MKTYTKEERELIGAAINNWAVSGNINIKGFLDKNYPLKPKIEVGKPYRSKVYDSVAMCTELDPENNCWYGYGISTTGTWFKGQGCVMNDGEWADFIEEPEEEKHDDLIEAFFYAYRHLNPFGIDFGMTGCEEKPIEELKHIVPSSIELATKVDELVREVNKLKSK